MTDLNGWLIYGCGGKKNKNNIAPNKTYDVHFNDDNNSNSKGFATTLQEAMYYIVLYNGTNESYFADYKGGTVSIVCNETGETVFEDMIA